MSKSQEKRKGGSQSKNALYNSASAYAPKAIKRLAELLDSPQDSVAVSAAKAILNKCLPDLKATELTGKDGDTLTFIVKRKDN